MQGFDYEYIRARLAKASVLAVAAVVLVACGGDSEEEAAPTGNQAPTISGSPPPQALQDSSYTFTPSANDPNGDTLTFSVSGLPGWGSFNTTNGRVSGTPTAANVGNYPNIQISVSDGQASASLGPFGISVVATATGSASLSWNAPTQNTDGSAYMDPAGYRIYYGTAQGNYTNSRTLNGVGLQAFVVEQLTPATWYFVVTAFDTTGNESAYSNVASKAVQ